MMNVPSPLLANLQPLGSSEISLDEIRAWLEGSVRIFRNFAWTQIETLLLKIVPLLSQRLRHASGMLVDYLDK